MPVEMLSTVASFRRRGENWRTWATLEPGKRGHRAYALRQAAMWDSLAEHADQAFAIARAKFTPGAQVGV